MNPPRKRGRGLDHSRDEPILHATVALLGEVGFYRFRMHDVAERAGVGLSTIYRRWPSRTDLIVAAFNSFAADPDPGDLLSLDGYRRQLEDLVLVLQTEQARLMPAILAAFDEAPELAEAFRSSWLRPRLDGLVSAVQGESGHAIAPATAEFVAEAGLGILMFRALVTHAPLDPSTIRAMVDELIRPLVEATSQNSQ